MFPYETDMTDREEEFWLIVVLIIGKVSDVISSILRR